jgi:hypothetical protein
MKQALKINTADQYWPLHLGITNNFFLSIDGFGISTF